MQNLGILCRLICLSLGLHSAEDLRFINNVKETKFQGDWGELQ